MMGSLRFWSSFVPSAANTADRSKGHLLILRAESSNWKDTGPVLIEVDSRIGLNEERRFGSILCAGHLLCQIREGRHCFCKKLVIILS